MEYYEHQPKAFKYQEGQFICHTYFSLPSNEKQSLEKIRSLFRSHQKSNTYKWEYNKDDPLHVTVLRGHRAIYKHQINSMIDAIEQVCDNISPFGICLDKIKIFSNNEKTRRFACMVSSTNYQNVIEIKKKIQETIDKFAIKLSNEDETEDTTLHCSLMNCPTDKVCQSDLQTEEESLRQICILHSSQREEPICYIHVDKIHIRIGNTVYNISLDGRL